LFAHDASIQPAESLNNSIGKVLWRFDDAGTVTPAHESMNAA
jgi:hypothetical protein